MTLCGRVRGPRVDFHTLGIDAKLDELPDLMPLCTTDVEQARAGKIGEVPLESFIGNGNVGLSLKPMRLTCSGADDHLIKIVTNHGPEPLSVKADFAPAANDER